MNAGFERAVFPRLVCNGQAGTAASYRIDSMMRVLGKQTGGASHQWDGIGWTAFPNMESGTVVESVMCANRWNNYPPIRDAVVLGMFMAVHWGGCGDCKPGFIDTQIERGPGLFGAISIVDPKRCGKATASDNNAKKGRGCGSPRIRFT